MPLHIEDEPEELNLPNETKTAAVLNSAKRKMRKIHELMKITETEVMESPKKYQVDLKEPVRRWKEVREKKKSQKVSGGTKDELEKLVKKARTNTNLYLDELDTLPKNKKIESKLTAEPTKTCQKELKEAEDNDHTLSCSYRLLDKSYVQSLEYISLEGEDQNVDDKGTHTLGNEDILEDLVNKLKEEKEELDAAKVETEKLLRDIELSRVAMDLSHLTKAQAAAIKPEEDKVAEKNEEMRNKIEILDAMVEKLKDEKLLQKSEADAAMVACEKLRRDVELSRVSVDMAKAETATLKAEKDKVEEQNEIEMRKKRKYIVTLIPELKRYYSDELLNKQKKAHGDCVPDSAPKGYKEKEIN